MITHSDHAKKEEALQRMHLRWLRLTEHTLSVLDSRPATGALKWSLLDGSRKRGILQVTWRNILKTGLGFCRERFSP